jgi:hypothetical protein
MKYAQLRVAVLRQDGDKTGAEAWLGVLPFIAELKEGSPEIEPVGDRGGPSTIHSLQEKRG